MKDVETTITVTDDDAEYVRQEAQRRGIGESDVWRELIDWGIEREETLSGLRDLEQLSKESLRMTERVAELLDPKLIEEAREDARVLLVRMKAAKNDRSVH